MSVIAKPRKGRPWPGIRSKRHKEKKKENLTAKLMNFRAGPKPTTYRHCLTIEGDSSWYGEGTSDGLRASYRVWISPSQNVLERIAGSSHYAQLMLCTCHVNGPYGSVTRLHKHEYELTKHSVRKHQMACNIQITMLRRPENSLECLLATEGYSCIRYPFSKFRKRRKGIHLHRRNVEKREI